MYLILLKDRSSWLRFLSWSKASLGTSLNEFRATFRRSRSLGKLWWKSACWKLEYIYKCVIAANHWSYGCKYNILKGGSPSELIPIRANSGKGRAFEGKLNHGLAPPPFFCIQYRSCQNHIKCKKIKRYIFFFFIRFCCISFWNIWGSY